MSEVIVVVDFLVKPGKQTEAEQFLLDLMPLVHAEDGCRLYAVHRGLDDPRRLVFVERWESKPLLDKHLQTDHIQTALSRVGEYFDEGPDIVFYEAVPGGDADKGSIAGHALGA